MKRLLIAAMFLGAFAAATNASQTVLRAGRWEITLKTVKPDVSPEMTAVVCITAEEADKKVAKPKSKADDDCQVGNDGGLHGNLLTYSVKCKTSKRETTANYTYNGDTYEGVVTVKDGKFVVEQLITAKRLGDCEPEVHP